MDQKLSNRLSFGHGLNDVPDIVSTTGYVVWYSMIRRAYSPVYHATKPTYREVEVADEWKQLSGFLPWFDANYKSGWHLDKDVLGDGKLYSPGTCCFIPAELNSLLCKFRKASGVYFKTRNNKFSAQYSDSSTGVRKSIYLGLFDEKEVAQRAYEVAKKQHIKVVADKYKDVLQEHVYNRLCDLK